MMVDHQFISEAQVANSIAAITHSPHKRRPVFWSATITAKALQTLQDLVPTQLLRRLRLGGGS